MALLFEDSIYSAFALKCSSLAYGRGAGAVSPVHQRYAFCRIPHTPGFPSSTWAKYDETADGGIGDPSGVHITSTVLPAPLVGYVPSTSGINLDASAGGFQVQVAAAPNDFGALCRISFTLTMQPQTLAQIPAAGPDQGLCKGFYVYNSLASTTGSPYVVATYAGMDGTDATAARMPVTVSGTFVQHYQESAVIHLSVAGLGAEFFGAIVGLEMSCEVLSTVATTAHDPYVPDENGPLPPPE
jgi:hypothetical protein